MSVLTERRATSLSSLLQSEVEPLAAPLARWHRYHQALWSQAATRLAAAHGRIGGKCWGELVRDQKGGEGELRVSLHRDLGEGTRQPWPDEDPSADQLLT